MVSSDIRLAIYRFVDWYARAYWDLLLYNLNFDSTVLIHISITILQGRTYG